MTRTIPTTFLFFSDIDGFLFECSLSHFRWLSDKNKQPYGTTITISCTKCIEEFCREWQKKIKASESEKTSEKFRIMVQNLKLSIQNTQWILCIVTHIRQDQFPFLLEPLNTFRWCFISIQLCDALCSHKCNEDRTIFGWS